MNEVDGASFLVNTGGKRGDLPLSGDRKAEILSYITQIAPDLPTERIRFVDSLELNTAYGSSFDLLNIGSDVLPGSNVGLGTSAANSRITWRGCLAHELIGHRGAAIAGETQVIDVLEEAQASIRAARFAPGLTGTERFILLRDAVNRLRNRGYKVRDVKLQLYIWKR